MAQRNLRIDIAAQFTGDRSFKSAEQAAKVMERELRKLEAAERALGQMQLQAGREMRAEFAARERAARDMARTQIAAEREMRAEMGRRRQAMADLAADAGVLAVGMGAALAAGLAVSARAAMEWESAFAGVRKVIDGTDAEMAALEGQLRGMAKSMPASAREIAGVAEAAGQLGVARQDVAAFTRTAIQLGVSTNLSAEDAATGLAKLGTIMGVATDQVDRAGAALVALGNDGASTEQDILQMALRIAGAGRLVGMTEGQVLGFANALSSVGIEAEAGGTAISRVFILINDAVRKGGENLDTFAQISGQSAEQFAAKWGTDAAGATAEFIAGLGRFKEAGGDVTGVLAELGLGEIRVRDTLLRTSQSSDQLTESVKLGSKAWDENSALVEEASRRFETSESRIKVARNQLNDVAIDIGAKVLPAFADLAEDVGTAADLFGGLPGPVKQTAVVIGAVAAGVGILGGAAAIAVPKVKALQAALSDMGPKGQAAAAGMSRLGSALSGPVGVGIAAGLTVATFALGNWSKAQIEARQRSDELRAAIEADNGALGANTALNVYKTMQEDGVLDLAKRLKVDLGDVTQAALGNAEALQRVNAALLDYRAEREAIGANGLVAEADTEQLLGALDTAYEKAKRGQAAWSEQNEVLQAAQGELAKTGQAAEGTGAAVGGMGGSAEDAAKALDDLGKSLADQANQALDARDAARDYQAAIDAANEAISKTTKRQRESGRALDITREAGRQNQEALDNLARAALRQAEAVRESTGSEASFRGSLEASRRKLVETAVRFGMNRTEAEKYAAAILAVPAVVKTEVKLTGLEAARNKIAGLSAELQQNTGLIAGIYQGVGGTPRKARGGLISGPPSTNDDVPILSSTGEYVVQASAVERYGVGLFDALNAQRLATGGQVGRYASGGMVTLTSSAVTGPLLGAYQSSLGTPVEPGDRVDALRKRRDATDDLRLAEAKLHAVQKDRKHTALELEQAEIRVRKARETLTAATARLVALDARAAAQRQTPLAQLSSALDRGVKDGAAFVRNIETLAARGFGELARQLAEQGDADAERIAAQAVRAKPSTVKAIQDKLTAATRIGAQREALPDIARAIDAMRARPNGSLDDLAAALGMDVPEVVDLLRLMGPQTLQGTPGGRHYAALMQPTAIPTRTQPQRTVPQAPVLGPWAGPAPAGGSGDTYIVNASTTEARQLIDEAMTAKRRATAMRTRVG